MKSHLKTQLNEFDQSIGIAVLPHLRSEYQAQALNSAHVRLNHLTAATLQQQDIEQLWACVAAEPDLSCWTYLPYTGFSEQVQLAQKLKDNFNFAGSTHYLIEVNQRLVGWVALLNPRPDHRAIEIGNVYFSAQMKQSTASTACIYLLLKSCFDQGFRRVEWKCDALNQPSYRAALRYGFEYEGTFRQDRIAKGRNRNTAWFSILDEEWPQLQQAYAAWLASDNFDDQGQQKIRLNDFVALYRSNK